MSRIFDDNPSRLLRNEKTSGPLFRVSSQQHKGFENANGAEASPPPIHAIRTHAANDGLKISFLFHLLPLFTSPVSVSRKGRKKQRKKKKRRLSPLPPPTSPWLVQSTWRTALHWPASQPPGCLPLPLHTCISPAITLRLQPGGIRLPEHLILPPQILRLPGLAGLPSLLPSIASGTRESSPNSLLKAQPSLFTSARPPIDLS